MLPKDESEIKAYVLLHLITKCEAHLKTHGESPYGPERDLVKRNLEQWKKEYYELLSK